MSISGELALEDVGRGCVESEPFVDLGGRGGRGLRGRTEPGGRDESDGFLEELERELVGFR